MSEVVIDENDPQIQRNKFEIPDDAFNRRHDIVEVILPSTIKIIGKRAFSGCKSLKKVILPPGLVSMGEEAFGGCESLESIIIPGSLKEVPFIAFQGCPNLKDIEIQDGVEIIGEGAFIYGESVLTMHGLALLNPTVLYVATSKRVRKTLPKFIKKVKVREIPHVYYEGIPSQDIVSAIIICREQIMTDRLSKAIEEAEEQGLISDEDRKYLKESLSI